MRNSSEKPATGVSDSINEFIQRNRKAIFIIAGTLIVLLIAAVVMISVVSKVRSNAIYAVEEINDRFESLRPLLNEEYSEGDFAELIAELETFAKKHSGYAGGRAWFITATIYSEKKEWADAENAWVNAAKTASKTYMSPIAWFNAGAAAEEQGKTSEAIEHYANSISAPAGFPSAARAQFSIGRLWESQGDILTAIDAYRSVISGWPNDSFWNDLAHSRIISLEAAESL